MHNEEIKYTGLSTYFISETIKQSMMKFDSGASHLVTYLILICISPT